MNKRKPPRYVYRSSVTGRWVTKAYAERHPDTTEKVRVGATKA